MSKNFWKRLRRQIHYSTIFILILVYTWGVHIPVTYVLALVVSILGSFLNGEFKYTFRNILYELRIDLKHIYSVSSLKDAWGVAMERVND